MILVIVIALVPSTCTDLFVRFADLELCLLVALVLFAASMYVVIDLLPDHLANRPDEKGYSKAILGAVAVGACLWVIHAFTVLADHME